MTDALLPEAPATPGGVLTRRTSSTPFEVHLDVFEGPFDLLVSNPPYIESAVVDGLMPEVAAHEPRLALDGGTDGLAAYRIIAAEAPRLVVAGGWAVVEAGEGQAPAIAALFGAAGLTPKPTRLDLGGIARVVPAQY